MQHRGRLRDRVGPGAAARSEHRRGAPVGVVPYPHGVIDRELPDAASGWRRLGAAGSRRLGRSCWRRRSRTWSRRPGSTRRRSSGSGSTSPPARSCRSTPRACRCASTTRWRHRRHAWPKLWKHHAAQPVADRLNEVALERGETFLARYGGRISSEWYFPKLIELWLEDREVYDEARAFIEATDWIVWWLTGASAARAARPATRRCGHPTRACRRERVLRGGLPGFDTPGDEARAPSSSPLGTRAGTLRPDAGAARSGCRSRSPSRSATSTRSCPFPAPGSSSPGRT